jgi:hypothetical protein
MIHRSRGHPELLEFFIAEFDGILVSDFWGGTEHQLGVILEQEHDVAFARHTVYVELSA